MIQIHTKRCIRCGACVKDCTSGVFRMRDTGPVALYPELCNHCSHCVAVCPKQAVIHEGLGPAPTAPLKKNINQAKNYREIALARRSIRHYRPDPVPREIIEEILDVARYSPSASNTQNVHYTVVTNRNLIENVSRRIFGIGERINNVFTLRPVQAASTVLKDIGPIKTLDRYSKRWGYFKEQVAAGRDLIFHKAPTLLLIHTPGSQNLSRDNCLIAATNVTNYAHTLGLGSCFIGILTTAMQVDRSLYRLFRIPKGHKVHAALTLGYPALTYTRHVVRKPPAVQWL